MSERKTAEIKFRVTPTFKASLQAAAQAADETMSVYIENAVELRRQAETQPTQEPPKSGLESWGLHPESEQSLALEAAVPAPFTGTPVPVEELLDAEDIAVIASDAEESPVAPGGLLDFISTNVTAAGPPLSKELLEQQMGIAAAPQTDVSTSGEVGASEEPQYPWMFRG